MFFDENYIIFIIFCPATRCIGIQPKIHLHPSSYEYPLYWVSLSTERCALQENLVVPLWTSYICQETLISWRNVWQKWILPIDITSQPLFFYCLHFMPEKTLQDWSRKNILCWSTQFVSTCSATLYHFASRCVSPKDQQKSCYRKTNRLSSGFSFGSCRKTKLSPSRSGREFWYVPL